MEWKQPTATGDGYIAANWSHCHELIALQVRALVPGSWHFPAGWNLVGVRAKHSSRTYFSGCPGRARQGVARFTYFDTRSAPNARRVRRSGNSFAREISAR